MMVSSKGRYALLVMIDLAENGGDSLIAMREVAARQGISLKYLEKIMPVLVSRQMVEGIHGKGGGYRLTRDPSEYSVGEILRLTEGGIAPVSCLDDCRTERCSHTADCRTLPLWNGLNDVIEEYLDHVTLADLMRKEETEPGAEG